MLSSYLEAVSNYKIWHKTAAKEMKEHNAFENDLWIEKLVTFVQEAIKSKTPIVGICFGHQIIARALGARIGRNPRGWELAVYTVDLSNVGKKLFGKDTLVCFQL